MTNDVIALTSRMPDTKELLAALHAGGPDLRVRPTGGGAVAQLCTAQGDALVSLEAPRLVQVPGEVNRLLGPAVRASAPVWWTEVRATSGIEGARRLAGSVAGRLAVLLGGTTWPYEGAQTDVVTISPGDGAGTTTDYPGIDVVTDKAAVVIQDRPIVAATSWLTDVIRTVSQAERELCLVTPSGTRLTHPTRTALQHIPARWVVSDPQCGYYDGLTGTVLHWHDGHFVPAPSDEGAPRIADAFRSQPAVAEGHQLHVAVRTIHPATEDLVLGEALAETWRLLTGAPPAGWGSAEPVNSPWSPRQLTELARARARQSQSTWLVAIGAPEHPAIATLRVTHTRAGVEEHIDLALGYPAHQPAPTDFLPKLAETLATRHHLATMVSELRRGRADLTTPATYEPPPIPLSLTIGPDAVAGIGISHARSAPIDVAPISLGPSAHPALHYTLGDGADPVAWHRLKQIDEHLGGTAPR
ncbi:DUF6177 family protein [Streptomyces sp. NPDC005863]|uniref:DUF6177 family protein n=1 Tax=unclassified Streptomyces TaxID=2593676 RepID=UPI003406956C